MTMGDMLDRHVHLGGRRLARKGEGDVFDLECPHGSVRTGPHGEQRAGGGRGPHLRPLEETARETVAWWNGLPEERRNGMRSGLRQPPGLAAETAPMAKQMEAEAKLLAAWKGRK